MALFYLFKAGRLVAIAVSHVYDVRCGCKTGTQDAASKKLRETFEFGKWESLKDGVVFRGRELKLQNGEITVKMVGYARKLKTAKIPRERRHDLASALTEAEVHTLQIGTGEAGWLARQLRFDCAMEVGELQRAAEGPCVGDLVKMNATLAELRRGADFTLHFPKGIDPMNCIVVVPADSGHCNGPDHDEIEKCKSVGGHFLLFGSPGVCRRQRHTHCYRGLANRYDFTRLQEHTCSRSSTLGKWH